MPRFLAPSTEVVGTVRRRQDPDHAAIDHAVQIAGPLLGPAQDATRGRRCPRRFRSLRGGWPELRPSEALPAAVPAGEPDRKRLPGGARLPAWIEGRDSSRRLRQSTASSTGSVSMSLQCHDGRVETGEGTSPPAGDHLDPMFCGTSDGASRTLTRGREASAAPRSKEKGRRCRLPLGTTRS